MSGPKQYDPTVTRLQGDGRYLHKFRQSFVGTFMNCPDSARHDMIGSFQRRNTDSTAVGTAVHAVIEEAVGDLMEHGVVLGVPELVELWHDKHWPEQIEHGDIQWVKRKPEAAARYGQRCIESFGTYVLPELDPLGTEVNFSDLEVWSDDRRTIVIGGTVDAIVRDALVDWKTAAQEYKRWEYDRWAIQPTFYHYALRHAPEMDQYRRQMENLGTWRYVVFPDDPSPQPQVVELERHPEHDAWLVQQLLSIAPLLEADLDVWPKRDQHALCSPKWCSAWDTCKGAVVLSPKWVGNQR
jgi:hypothetical protein